MRIAFLVVLTIGSALLWASSWANPDDRKTPTSGKIRLVTISPELSRIFFGTHYAVFAPIVFSGDDHLAMECKRLLVGVDPTVRNPSVDRLRRDGTEIGLALRSSETTEFVPVEKLPALLEQDPKAFAILPSDSPTARVLAGNEKVVRLVLALPFTDDPI